MRIHSVELENFKTHVRTKVDFSKGLNLILGLNGAGKTSILQALGFALAGVKWEGNYGDFITNFNDSTTAIVKISFIANDDLEYQIIRKIEEKHTTWELFSSNGSAWKTQSEVLNVLKVLTGINGEMADVYKRVITAHQNDITSIFSMPPSKRKTFFDELFNTQIYKKLAQNELKEYVDEMEKTELKLKTKRESVQETVEDLKDTQEDLDEALNEIEKLEEKVKSLSTLKLMREEELEKNEKIKVQIEKFNDQRKEWLRRLEDKKKELEELNQRMKKALESKRKCEKFKKQHDEYERVLAEIEEDEELLCMKEKNVDALRKEDRKLSNVKAEIERLNTILLSSKERKEEISHEVRKIEENIIENRQKVEKLLNEKREISSSTDELSVSVEEAKKTLEKVEKLADEIFNIESRKKEISQNLKKLENSVEKVKELERKLKDLKEKEDKLNDLNAEKYSLKEKMENLALSQESLKNGICPLLNERCLNLEGKNISEYFHEKREILRTRLDGIDDEVEKIEREISSLKEIEKIVIREKQNEKMFNESTLRMKQLEDEEKGMIFSLRELLKIQKLSNEIESRDILQEVTNVKKNSQENFQKLESQRRSLVVKKEEIEEKIKMIENAVRELKMELKRKKENLKELSKEIEIHKKRIKEMEETKLFLLKKTENLEKMEEELKILKDEMAKKRENTKNLKTFYDEYNKNFESATELEHLLTKVKETEDEKKKIKAKLNALSKSVEELSKSFDEEKSEKLKNDLKTLEADMKNLNMKIGEHKHKIETLKRELQDLKKKKAELKKINEELEIMKNKKRFVSEFRKMLNEMGSEMARRYRKGISIKATLKYQSLTGKTDVIEWKNDYAVHLISSIGDKKSDRRFSHLSGGEQVIVALCIRAALNEIFSRSKFVIFDEPTVNLDEEKRRALSEYLPKLFEDMEQVILITHDENFREMAEKVIFVEKENGISVVR